MPPKKQSQTHPAEAKRLLADSPTTPGGPLQYSDTDAETPTHVLAFSEEEEQKFQRRFENGYDLKTDARYNKWLKAEANRLFTDPPTPLQYSDTGTDTETPTQVLTFSEEEEQKFQRRFENGYDLKTDARYNKWLKQTHPAEAKRILSNVSSTTGNTSDSEQLTFTEQDIRTFQQRFENGYRVTSDARYNRWLKLMHPEAAEKNPQKSFSNTVNMVPVTTLASTIMHSSSA